MNHSSAQPWIVFTVVAATAFFLDQFLFSRQTRRVSFQRALIESACWVVVSLAFGVWVYWSLGPRVGIEFFTGYLIEKSLSLDNIFVFLLIFQAFRIPTEFQSKALYGGIAGALFFRGVFVVTGIKLLAFFHAFEYILGAFLLLVGIKLLITGGREVHPERNWVVRLTQKVFPVVSRYDTGKFFLMQNRRWHATPLFLTLIAIETMDLVFAADSVPAVLAITRNTFIAYSSNVFAVLGLRALYFAVAAIFPRFRFLRQGIAAILLFVALKMLFNEKLPVSTFWSLAVICGILAFAIVASVVAPPKTTGGPAD